MKKTTVGLIATLLVIMLNSNAWAQTGLRIDVGGNGFGISVSDGYSGLSTFSYSIYRPYPYYSGYYPYRTYLRWGSYQGYPRTQHNHKHWAPHNYYNHKSWSHHRPGHHHKGHINNHQRNYKSGGHDQRQGSHRRHHHNGRQWRR
jgi:hypothetical protein